MDEEVLAFLKQHLQTIQQNDVEAYNRTCAEDLTLYEWWVTPQRIDGLPFHEFMMNANAQRGTVFGAEAGQGARSVSTRFDLANLRIQRYGETAIASYTLLVSTATPEGVGVASHNETRVMVKREGTWKVVHVHKSPAWQAPHVPPAA
jgi:ketosteroid isomerase-like protein